MSDQFLSSIVGILTAIIGVAILAVLVSRQSNTSGVIGAFGSAFSSDLATALSPITGGGGSTFSGGGVGQLMGNY